MNIQPNLWWLAVGTLLCLVEVLIPTAFVSLILGLGAIGVALIVSLFPLVFAQQILVWAVLAAGIAGLIYRGKTELPEIDLHRTEARSITAFSPGKLGRVRYEGASWQAKCGDEAIAPDRALRVLGREGTTLLVTAAPATEVN
jgi:membrane protein implicated in regulation of membrane protease activity